MFNNNWSVFVNVLTKGYSFSEFTNIVGNDFNCELGVIEYPENGIYGPNLLNPDVTVIDFSSDGYIDYSMAANLPENTSLKIRISLVSDSTFPSGIAWYYAPSRVINYAVSKYSEYSQTFTSIVPGINCDLLILLAPGTEGDAVIKIEYFENNASEPTFEKDVIIK